jgi:hypothetical protein
VVRRTTAVGDYWRRLRQCGWLESIPAAEHRALRERIAAALAEDPATAYQALAATTLDLECIVGSGADEVCSYHSVLEQLADASRGSFKPEDILDELDPALGVARVSFCVAELSFHAELPFRDDRVQAGLFELVNRALESSGEPARFRALPADGQVVGRGSSARAEGAGPAGAAPLQFARLAFVPDAVFERARAAGVIPA